ncbi:hypothetical protein DP117_08915 [Brasilonema sp. UFV-L1]|nr:hypothetical protein [Brasilonema sp. UFV-L1]
MAPNKNSIQNPRKAYDISFWNERILNERIPTLYLTSMKSAVKNFIKILYKTKELLQIFNAVNTRNQRKQPQ